MKLVIGKQTQSRNMQPISTHHFRKEPFLFNKLACHSFMQFFLLIVILIFLTPKISATPQDIHVIIPFYENTTKNRTQTSLFWSVFERGAKQAAKDSATKITYKIPKTNNIEQMITMIEASLNQEANGLILAIHNRDAVLPTIRQLKVKKIPFFTVATEENTAYDIAPLLNIGDEAYQTGQIIGARLKKNGGKYATCVITESTNVNQLLLCNGFIRGFGGSGKVKRIITTSNQAFNVITNQIKLNPRIDSFFILQERLAPELIHHLHLAKKLEKSHIAVLDHSAEMLKTLSLPAASLYAIDNQPYLQGYLAVITMAKYLETGVLPTRNILTSPFFIDIENVEKVLELQKNIFQKPLYLE